MQIVHLACGHPTADDRMCDHCGQPVVREEEAWLRPWRSAIPFHEVELGAGLPSRVGVLALDALQAFAGRAVGHPARRAVACSVAPDAYTWPSQARRPVSSMQSSSIAASVIIPAMAVPGP
jgi:hypothetical protein